VPDWFCHSCEDGLVSAAVAYQPKPRETPPTAIFQFAARIVKKSKPLMMELCDRPGHRATPERSTLAEIGKRLGRKALA
jgi:hypothetical protein